MAAVHWSNEERVLLISALEVLLASSKRAQGKARPQFLAVYQKEVADVQALLAKVKAS